MDAMNVIFSYFVDVTQYPEMALPYWLDKWSDAWEWDEYVKRRKEVIPDVG